MTHDRKLARPKPFDARKLLESRLDLATGNVDSFLSAVQGGVASQDWSGAVQSARGLLDAVRNLLETAVAREVFAHLEAGVYLPVETEDVDDKA